MPGLKPGFGRLASLRDAFDTLRRYLPELSAQTIPLREALGRVLAADVVAPIDVPHFTKAAMDGYAVRAEDTFGSSAEAPSRLRVIGCLWPGEVFGEPVESGQAVEIGTGAAMPPGADAVVMVEYTEHDGDAAAVLKAVAPGDNVIRPGSDVAAGSVVLRAGTALEPRHVGALSALGLAVVTAWRRPRVALFSTGNEILQPGDAPEPGKIFDINTWTLRAALEADGCEPVELGLAPDTRDALRALFERALEIADVVLLSGGSSLGGGDLVGEVLDEIGRALIHGVAIKPGKPVVIGAAKDPVSGAEKAVIGLPGYPMSCLSDYYILVQPFLDEALGRTRTLTYVDAHMARKHASTVGRYEFLPVRVSEGRAHPLTKGSSAITTLSEATGFVEIDENVEVVEAGTPVRVRLF